MAFSPKQCENADKAQLKAAHDNAPQVRLVAGPGSGKSRAIEARVCWLLEQGVDPKSIYAVSFTRAASRDLKERIETFCAKGGHEGKPISVSTLHSLALRILAEADLLKAYPVTPLVLDDWEVENIFDREFSDLHGITMSRCGEIRDFFQAYWDTNSFNHHLYVAPDKPITIEEREWFQAFNNERTQLYSCILSGELVRKCVEQMNSNLLDPTSLIGMRHLIVDEFQDLNSTDQRFIKLLVENGVTLFAAGDDDQSIYSFRYASPEGIQAFKQAYPASSSYALDACFRCTPNVLDAAKTLISANSEASRIRKNHFSLYETSEPVVAGSFHRWKFDRGDTEAEAIANSCAELISVGVQPKDILILLANKSLGTFIVQALDGYGIQHTPLKATSFVDTNLGRLVFSLVRIVLNPDDYFAHRTILGVLNGVGPRTCNAIARKAIDHTQNFRKLFYNALPANVFGPREAKPLCRAWDVCNKIKEWKGEDSLGVRRDEFVSIINEVFGDEEVSHWLAYSSKLPDVITLQDFRGYLGADSDEKRARVIHSVSEALGLPPEEQPSLPNRVQIMTMHSAKGLSAHVVFVPGLEENSLPGEKRSPYHALVLEAARMLYVSITRARAACIVSFASNRFLHGKVKTLSASRFAKDLNGVFETRDAQGLQPEETSRIMGDCNNLF